MERLQFTEFAAKSDDARSVGNAKQGPSDNASHAELTEVAAGMDLWLGPMTLQIRIIGPDDLLLISDKSDTLGAIATPLPTTPSLLSCVTSRRCTIRWSDGLPTMDGGRRGESKGKTMYSKSR